jgi:hypothetical protein
LSWLLSEAGIVRAPESASEKLPEREYGEDVPLSALLNSIERSKAGIENIYTNHMPFYMSVVGFMRDIERESRQFLLDIVDPLVPLAPQELTLPDESGEEPELFDASIYRSVKIGSDANNHDYYLITPGHFIEGAVNLDQDALRERADAQANAINRIAAAASLNDVNTYVYNVSRMQDFEYFAQIVRNVYSTRRFRDYFNSQLNPDIISGWLDLSDIDTALEKIYRTDHHWAPRGSYSGYTDVINMMRERHPDIGEPYPMGEIITIEGVRWRGYYAALSAYSAIFEDFTVLDMDLPPHTMYDARGNAFEYRHDAYMEGRFPTDTFFGHFNHYHGQQHRVSYPGNNTGRNLLWIGDSMTYSVARLIGAHFDETYMLYPWEHGEVEFEDFLEEYNITDVLFLIFSDRLMFNMYGDCDFSRFRTWGDR